MTSILKPLDTKTALERQHPNFSQEEAPHKHIMSTRAGIIFCCLLAVALAGENIVRVPGVKCGFFDVINHMTLMGFNAKTLDGLTSFDCIEACALEKTFYCRFQSYHTCISYLIKATDLRANESSLKISIMLLPCGGSDQRGQSNEVRGDISIGNSRTILHVHEIGRAHV